MKKICYLFPGQGAQYVGMGKDLYDNCQQAKGVFEEVETILPDVDIKKLCFEGPVEELIRTANSQVAMLAVSVAALEAFNYRAWGTGHGVEPVSCAGLSLGELTALVASGSIEFKDAVRLVRRRGELMEDASVKNPGDMASIIGLSIEDLEKICSEVGSEIANLNCPGQTVISGTKEAIQAAIELAGKKGAKKSIRLNVSGPFHSSLMKGAADLFREELKNIKFSPPSIRVISNVTADYESSPEGIKENLVKQLYSPVRWEESIRMIAAQGLDTFFEIGPGKVLKGLLRRIDPGLKVYNIEKMGDIDYLKSQI